jgi:hypothetical protein
MGFGESLCYRKWLKVVVLIGPVVTSGPPLNFLESAIIVDGEAASSLLAEVVVR